MTEGPEPVTIRPARRSVFERASFVWLIPIAALIIALGVAWNAYWDQGPLIRIEFANGAGIGPRETELKYRDITVGVVEDVTFSDGLKGVVAAVRLDKNVAPYVDAGASFWVVRPELTARGVSGLDTVLSGVFIEGTWDSEIGPEQNRFSGLSEAPLYRPGEGGLQIALRTRPGGSLTDNSPILYRGIEVGRIGEASISQTGNYAIAEAIIYEPHGRLVTDASRFWDTSGFSVSIGPTGAQIDFSSLASLLAGGISFDTFVSGGSQVADGTVFEVFVDDVTARSSLFNASEVEVLQLRAVFERNISGLTVGAPVELSGLKIGTVDSVSGIVDEDAFGDKRVRLNVALAIQPARLGLPDEVSPAAAQAFLAERVDEGLRARLASASLLTGGLKVELVQVDNATPLEMTIIEGRIPAIPTTDSEIADAAATVEGVFTRINNLPVEELLTSAIDFLDSAEALVSDPDLRETPQDVRALLGDVRGIVSSQDVKDIPVTINAALSRIETLLTQLETEQVVGKLIAAIDTATKTADGIGTSVDGLPKLIAELNAVAAKANELPLEQLTQRLSDVVASIDVILKDEDTKELPADLRETINDVQTLVANVRRLVASQDVQAIPTTLNTALGRFDSLLADLETEQAVARLLKAVDSASKAATDVSNSVEGAPALVERLNAVAAKADKLPVEELTQQITELVKSAEAILDQEDTRRLPGSLGAALDEINATLLELRKGGAVANVNATLASARNAADKVAMTAEDLPELVDRITRVFDQASATIKGYDRGDVISRDAQAALRDIQKAADAVASLARLLERNPSALIRGR